MRIRLVVLSICLCLPGAAAAQGFCTPPKDSHEAQMFQAHSVPLAFAFAESPGPLPSGAVRIALEGTYLPNIDESIRTSTLCRPGKGPENTDFLSVYPRPRVAVGLPGRFRFEASWIPPIRLNQVKSNLIGLSIDRGFPVGGRGTEVVVRAHATLGVIEAPVTCNDDGLADPSSECFQGTRSNDHYHPNIFGLETLLAWSLGGGRVRPFVGAGANLLHSRFQVNFTNRFGALDNTKVEADMTRGALLAGATWEAASGLGLTGEIYATPGDAVTGRVTVGYALRR